MRSDQNQKLHARTPQDIVGIQTAGSSSNKIYTSCIDILEKENALGGSMMDVGGGKGSFSSLVKSSFDRTVLLDYSPSDLPHIEVRGSDLNQPWPAKENEFNVAVALEVIEHLENPRHFFREIVRTVRSGGLAILSTPNQTSIVNRLCFLLRSQHQQFQDNCYPAHITALLDKDFERISLELGQPDFSFYYSNSIRIPGTKLYLQSAMPWARGRAFSDNIFFALRIRKPPP